MPDWNHRWFGLWDVPPYGETPYPKIDDFLGPEADMPADRAELAEYLKGGKPLVGANRYYVPDPVTGLRDRGVLNLRTDGRWTWADDLGDLLLRHPLVLPPGLLQNIRQRKYHSPRPGEAVDPNVEWPPPIEPDSKIFWRFSVDSSLYDPTAWGYRWYGFWADPESTSDTLPRIQPYLTQSSPVPDLQEIVGYLRQGLDLPLGVERTNCDPVTGERYDGLFELLTDGEWVWHSTLPDLLERYPLALPEAMLADIRARIPVAARATNVDMTTLDLPPGYPPFSQANIQELMAWMNTPICP